MPITAGGPRRSQTPLVDQRMEPLESVDPSRPQSSPRCHHRIAPSVRIVSNIAALLLLVLAALMYPRGKFFY